MLLWLWLWLAAAALIQSLTWELPCAIGVALKKTKKKKKKNGNKKPPVNFCSYYLPFVAKPLHILAPIRFFRAVFSGSSEVLPLGLMSSVLSTK